MEGEYLDDETTHGVIPRMVNSIFEGIFNAPAHVEFYVKVRTTAHLESAMPPELPHLPVRI